VGTTLALRTCLLLVFFPQKPTQRWRAAPDRCDSILPGAVVSDLMDRDLSDHDYELLLQLDRCVTGSVYFSIYTVFCTYSFKSGCSVKAGTQTGCSVEHRLELSLVVQSYPWVQFSRPNPTTFCPNPIHADCLRFDPHPIQSISTRPVTNCQFQDRE